MVHKRSPCHLLSSQITEVNRKPQNVLESQVRVCLLSERENSNMTDVLVL